MSNVLEVRILKGLVALRGRFEKTRERLRVQSVERMYPPRGVRKLRSKCVKRKGLRGYLRVHRLAGVEKKGRAWAWRSDGGGNEWLGSEASMGHGSTAVFYC